MKKNFSCSYVETNVFETFPSKVKANFYCEFWLLLFLSSKTSFTWILIRRTLYNKCLWSEHTLVTMREPRLFRAFLASFLSFDTLHLRALRMSENFPLYQIITPSQFLSFQNISVVQRMPLSTVSPRRMKQFLIQARIHLLSLGPFNDLGDCLCRGEVGLWHQRHFGSNNRQNRRRRCQIIATDCIEFARRSGHDSI